jgi:hypothetical protein
MVRLYGDMKTREHGLSSVPVSMRPDISASLGREYPNPPQQLCSKYSLNYFVNVRETSAQA